MIYPQFADRYKKAEKMVQVRRNKTQTWKSGADLYKMNWRAVDR